MTDSQTLRTNNRWVQAPSSDDVYYCPHLFLNPPPYRIALPSPPIRARQFRGRAIHITEFPDGFPEGTVIGKLFAPFHHSSSATPTAPSTPSTPSTPTAPTQSAISSATATPTPSPTPSTTGGGLLRRLSINRARNYIHDAPRTMLRSANVVEAMYPAIAPPTSFPSPLRTSSSVYGDKNIISASVSAIPKPVAAGSGVSCSILLAEPHVFLSGFDHDGHGHNQDLRSAGAALLRGKLQLSVTKKVKLKGISLKLQGRARTEWPEGIPPLKTEMFEESSLRTQVLTFFNALNDGWETEYGNQCTYTLNRGSPDTPASQLIANGRRSSFGSPAAAAAAAAASAMSPVTHALSSREAKRLSLQVNHQSRSFGKGDVTHTNAVQIRGYKVFPPGTYEYAFELPIDHHQVETTKLPFGSVKWELHATVERAGAFKANLHGQQEVSIIRVPDQLSLETSEPISINRQWEDQLHYDIVISGKSFPIGSKIPVAMKLTPLAKVQVHKLKVFCTESIEYWTNDRRVTRKDAGRKILLLEKVAGKPLDPRYAASHVRVLCGGELSPEDRQEAREAASMRRVMEASRRDTSPEPLPKPTDNLLGDLELGLESCWGPTELELDVQIPTCDQMEKSRELRVHPDCTWKNASVHHWIKVVLRISRLDPDDPSGTRRRHFEISIDSPFTVLNCHATRANMALPEYSGAGNESAMMKRPTICGCFDAAATPGSVDASSLSSSTGTLPRVNSGDTILAAPQAAHLTAPGHSPSPLANVQTWPHQQHFDVRPRPIHLLRVPSFNPPAFDADQPPPGVGDEGPGAGMLGLQTPPPQYDLVVGTPSVDGLADYFARLADYGYDAHEEETDSDEGEERIMERGGRVNVAHPRTPGGRRGPSRSMEIRRPPVELRTDSLPVRR
ncbi:hypothetical protein SODALDRAFT_312736 [Sodiomyces alkalinus F11]|uniref:Arrestin C-terminal-like domain-containing protein n=1 Tax=Sodiomyces alkalinus (strain CBS 110278 / VKM F-3762 / F11) TaxID=1314773 RepID=A0A3N2PUK6_SODAK|nr:hypothetical protein SODALDRAFT_312736 [Sodiomyces alkalinus F11]ROT38183.1 hypothetical protein SODALDRAFT_312736 [Sodiomyces alkalinus F11]